MAFSQRTCKDISAMTFVTAFTMTRRLPSVLSMFGLMALATIYPAPAQVASQAQAPGQAPSPAGLWFDHTGRGIVEIVPCANNLCGRIVWLQNPLDNQGRPLRDLKNEEV